MITKEMYERTYPKGSVASKALVMRMAATGSLGGKRGKSGGKGGTRTGKSQSGKASNNVVPAKRGGSQGKGTAASKSRSASRSKSGEKVSVARRMAAHQRSPAAHRTAAGKAGSVHGRTTYYRARESERRRKLKFLMAAVILLLALAMLRSCFLTIDVENLRYPDYIQQNFIAVDGHSRTGNKMTKVRDIVIHYVANPGSTAKANRDYFASSESKVSAHFVVGLKGEVIQCVPLDEESSASNQRNPDTISIEVCHPDQSGRFNDKTYSALVQLTAWLCDEFHLDESHLIRHYDITGKNCPKYYVEHPDAWKQFKEDVGRYR